MKNQKKNFSFFNMGTSSNFFYPPRFFKFSPEPAKFVSGIEIKALLNASICDIMMVKSLLRVDPTQSYGENTKNPIQDFIDFAMKTIKN